MTIKTYIYAITLMISIFALSGVNFDGFIKKNKAIEARILVILLGISMSYMITNFITDFLNFSKLIN